MGIQGNKISKQKTPKDKLVYILGIARNVSGGQWTTEEVAGDDVKEVFKGHKPDKYLGAHKKLNCI